MDLPAIFEGLVAWGAAGLVSGVIALITWMAHQLTVLKQRLAVAEMQLDALRGELGQLREDSRDQHAELAVQLSGAIRDGREARGKIYDRINDLVVELAEARGKNA